MDCKHMIKIDPIYNEEEGFFTIGPHYSWLKKNEISRYRCSGFPSDYDQYKGFVSFRFADVEDAMAFKLRWA